MGQEPEDLPGTLCFNYLFVRATVPSPPPKEVKNRNSRVLYAHSGMSSKCSEGKWISSDWKRLHGVLIEVDT